MAAYLSDDMDQQANNAQNAYDGYQNAKNLASKFGGHNGASVGSAAASATAAGSAGGAATGASAGATAGSAGGPVGSAVGTAAGVAVDQLKDNSGAISVATCSGTSCCCCGCVCTPLIALILLIAILFTELSPSYLLGDMYSDFIADINAKGKQSYIDDLSDDILQAYKTSYKNALNNCKEEIGNKKSSYSNANLLKNSNKSIKIADTVGGLSKMDNGGPYTNTHSITVNGATFNANYEYIIITPQDADLQNIEDIANVPYIIGAFDYYISNNDKYNRDGFFDYVFGSIGDALGFSEQAKLTQKLKNELLGSLNQSGSDDGLFSYRVMESNETTVNGKNVNVKYSYSYKTTSYSYKYEDGNNIYAKRDENDEIELVNKNTSGAKEFSKVIKNREEALDFIEENNNNLLAKKIVEKKSIVTSKNKQTVEGNYYTGVVYMNDLYSMLSNVFNFDVSTKDNKSAVDEIAYKAGMFETYSESELGKEYLKGDINAIMTCNGSQIPEYFATEEKNNYGLVAWAKMANTYDSTSTDPYGMDSPARWGYVWGHRGSKFTSSGYTSVYNVSDGHYKNNLAAYTEIAKWIGHRVSDCNGLCVGYVDCTLNNSGNVVINATLPYGVGGTVRAMDAVDAVHDSINTFDENMIGQVLMVRSGSGKYDYQHIGIYCGFNSATNCYEVIHASYESVGVIKSSYKTVDGIKKSWDEWGYLVGVKYYEAGTSEAVLAENKANIAICGMVQ